jgi:hypothetical protein
MKNVLLPALSAAVLVIFFAGPREGLCARTGGAGRHAQRVPAGERPSSRHGMIVGTVTYFDPASRVLSIRNGGSVIAFDVSNPTLSGYKSVDGIRSGDRVGVMYTEAGVRIARLSAESAPRAASGKPTAKPGQSEGIPVVKVSPVQKHAKPANRLQRRQVKGDGRGFEDADVNKDGKVTPVELSVIIPDITMERFRQYDKDCNGCLNQAEFRKAMEGRP